MEDLTPRQIVAELDRFIVGQGAAKRAVAIALRNRWRRARLDGALRDEVIPKNILMIGPTGVGKTEIARRLARLASAPFLKVEATKFTEVGYVGRDVDAIVRDLVQVSLRLVEAEMAEKVKDRADAIAVGRVVDALSPRRQKETAPGASQFADFQRQMAAMFGTPPAPTPPPTPPADEETDRKEDRVRQVLREQVAAGLRDDDEVEIEVEEAVPGAVFPLFGPQGEGQAENLSEMLSQSMPRRTRTRRTTIREARRIFAAEAARMLVDPDELKREAITRAEESGIVFIDEMDKIAGRGREGGGPDVSREGVQRDLLPIIEGSSVTTRWGPVRTNHILFIAAGAFHVSKPSDLIPELQGRLPIRVELESLTEADFRRILTEPHNSLTRQYAALLETEGVTLRFEDDGIAELARIAVEVNRRTENIGARRLHTVLERLLDEVSFDAPDTAQKHVVVTGAMVRARLGDLAVDDEISRYIL